MHKAMKSFLTTVSPDSNRPILLPNTSVNTLELVEELENMSGRIVVTANQASIWQALELLSVCDKPKDAGHLFTVS